MRYLRVSAAALTLSAAGFIGIIGSESFVPEAIIPTKNDRPTLGYGSTYHPDGTPVKLGDKITPDKALITIQAHISKEEEIFRNSLQGAELTQGEYDVYMDWVYQYGTGAWSKSSMLRYILQGNYVKACDSLLLYKYSGGYDCSTPGNKICAGVWTRQLKRHEACLGANEISSIP